MRQKLSDLMIYHSSLDSTQTIDLLKSFEHGRLEHISQHVDKKNVNTPIGVCGYLPIELAIIFDHVHLFNFLVHDLKADLNIKNKLLESMPFVALAYQRRSYLIYFLSIDISGLYNLTPDTRRSLVHEAAILGDSRTLTILLGKFGFYKNLTQKKLDYILYDKYKCSPLYYASWLGHVDIFKQLLDCYVQNGIRIEDSSIGISILSKRFDCAKLLVDKRLEWPVGKSESVCLSELDCWLDASIKLESFHEFSEMKNLFHELALNGCKFSNFIFDVIDKFNISVYTQTSSLFLKCLILIFNYNLERLFDKRIQIDLFLKSLFVKLSEMFSFSIGEMDGATLQWFKQDFRKFLNAIYSNGISFKYFKNRKFFNFIRSKNSLMYELIEQGLYSDYSSGKRGGVQPLSLENLCKLKIKASMKQLDIVLIEQLPLPKQLCKYLSNELAQGINKNF